MRPTLPASEAWLQVQPILDGSPVFFAGSAAAAIDHGKDFAYSDLDLFVPTQQVLVSTVQTLLDAGYTLDEREDRVWYRWLRYGLKGWHTNSLRLHSQSGVETNVVFKLVDGHPTTTLSQVLESFDFGLLGVGYDFETRQWRDLRPYLFGRTSPWPMMPGKRENWVGGFISQYNGVREPKRWLHYSKDYGYDMSLVTPDLVLGLQRAALWHSASTKEDKQLLAMIYTILAEHIISGNYDEMRKGFDRIEYTDSLEEILEALE